jgi:hypothetical protein
MSKTIKKSKPEDTSIRWLHKAVNADGTVANGTYKPGKNANKRSLHRAIRKAKRG